MRYIKILNRVQKYEKLLIYESILEKKYKKSDFCYLFCSILGIFGCTVDLTENRCAQKTAYAKKTKENDILEKNIKNGDAAGLLNGELINGELINGRGFRAKMRLNTSVESNNPKICRKQNIYPSQR